MGALATRKRQARVEPTADRQMTTHENSSPAAHTGSQHGSAWAWLTSHWSFSGGSASHLPSPDTRPPPTNGPAPVFRRPVTVAQLSTGGGRQGGGGKQHDVTMTEAEWSQRHTAALLDGYMTPVHHVLHAAPCPGRILGRGVSTLSSFADVTTDDGTPSPTVGLDRRFSTRDTASSPNRDADA